MFFFNGLLSNYKLFTFIVLSFIIENYFTESFEASDLFRLVEELMTEASDELFQQIADVLGSQKDKLNIASLLKTGRRVQNKVECSHCSLLHNIWTKEQLFNVTPAVPSQ